MTRIDGIQYADASLVPRCDEPPLCEVCHVNVAELIADACCRKWTCTECGHLYRGEGVFCAKHLPDVEEMPRPVPYARIDWLDFAEVWCITWNIYPWPGGNQWETRKTLQQAIERVRQVTGEEA